MILTQAPPTLRLPRRHDRRSEIDLPQLSATLHELALRAYRLVRATDLPGWEPPPGTGSDFAFDPDRELFELHAQIVQLQRNLRARNLKSIAAYVSALQRRVEECLASPTLALVAFPDLDFS